MLDVLSPQHTIETHDPFESGVEATTNRYIIDDIILQTTKALRSLKMIRTSTDITPQGDFSGDIWELIDGFLTTPTKPTLLANRVKNLVSLDTVESPFNQLE